MPSDARDDDTHYSYGEYIHIIADESGPPLTPEEVEWLRARIEKRLREAYYSAHIWPAIFDKESSYDQAPGSLPSPEPGPPTGREHDLDRPEPD